MASPEGLSVSLISALSVTDYYTPIFIYVTDLNPIYKNPSNIGLGISACSYHRAGYLQTLADKIAQKSQRLNIKNPRLSTRILLKVEELAQPF